MESMFIYVQSKEDRDMLLAHGFTMIQEDDARSLYVFLNDGNTNFSSLPVRKFALSDTLTF